MTPHQLFRSSVLVLLAALTSGMMPATTGPADPLPIGAAVGLEAGGAGGSVLASTDLTDRTDTLIVRPATASSYGDIRSFLARTHGPGVAVGRRIGSGEARLVHLDDELPLRDLRSIAGRLVAEGLAELAEPDIRMVPLVVNDPFYPFQWHLWGDGRGTSRHGIDVEPAWERTIGSAEITVAVLDTGSLDHPDLAGRIIPGYDMISDAAAARDGDGRDPDPSDEGDWAGEGECGDPGPPAMQSSWHGLHVAGTIGATTDNDVGVAGVDQRARIQHVRVLGRCGGRSSDVADGIRWAAGLPVVGVPDNPTPARVINLSLAGNGACGVTMQAAVTAAIGAGTVVVAAAGNANVDAGEVSPASCAGVITVAATSPIGDRAGFSDAGIRTPYSNYGTVVDLAAPGGDGTFSNGGVVSTFNSGTTTPKEPTYAGLIGTSMAAPHVSGVISLMLALNRDLSPSEIRTILVETARPFGASTGVFACSSNPAADYHCGAGIVDAGAAVAAVLDPADRPTAPVLGAAVGDLEVALDWSPSVSVHGPLAYEVRRSADASCTTSSPLLSTVTGLSYVDTGLVHGTTYRYCVTALDADGRRSPASNTRSVTATDLSPPGAPSLSAVGRDRQVSVSWTSVADPTPPITYRLHRSTSSSCSPTSPLIRTQTGRTYTDSGLEPGTTYRYCVTATDGAGNGSPRSNVATATTEAAPPVCHAFVGDWDGSGRDGFGWWCDGRTKLRTAAGVVTDFTYGRPGDVPVVADWNGNGRDTVSVIRDGTWHVNNALRGGAAERTFVYGRVTRGDVPITGRWDRGRRDLPGIVRDREWHLRDAQSGGSSTWRFVYGRLTAGDLPLVGDWNGDGRDTVGIVRQGEWNLRNSLAGGTADIAYTYGRVLAGDVPVVGDWNGDGMDTPAIVRDGRWYLKNRHGGGTADRTITFRAP